MHKKTVLVTGASRGIGRAIAMTFAQNNYHVFLNCRHSISELESVKSAIEAIPYGSCDIFIGDVGNPHSVKELYEMIYTKYDCLDVLVNNAGIAQQKLFTDITPDEWKKMTGVNLDGVFYCSQQALKRYMIKNHSGVILNISSMWGQVGASCEVHYSASKAGVIGLTKGLAKEVGLSGVRVNCICPGVIMTDMMKGFDEQTVQELKEETPLNMLGMPEDIAETAVFLCSDRARFITGQIVGVNGGMII